MANDILAQALALFQQGFDTVNSIQGLVIALIAAFMMRRFGQLIAWAITATIAHEVVNRCTPVTWQGDASILPQSYRSRPGLEPDWHSVLGKP